MGGGLLETQHSGGLRRPIFVWETVRTAVSLMEIGKQRRFGGETYEFSFRNPELEVSLRHAGADVMQSVSSMEHTRGRGQSCTQTFILPHPLNHTYVVMCEG